MRINLLPEAERPLKQNAIRWEFLVIFFGLVLFITINTYAYLQTLTIQMQQQKYDDLVSYGNMLQHQYQKVSALQNENQELSDKLPNMNALSVLLMLIQLPRICSRLLMLLQNGVAGVS